MSVINKKSSGQSGCDGNGLIRNKTVKFLCSVDEHQKIIDLAKIDGVPTIAQFVREKTLSDTTQTTRAQRNAVLGCQRELVRIGNHCRDIIKQLHLDNELDRATFGAIKDIQKLAFKIYEKACAKHEDKE